MVRKASIRKEPPRMPKAPARSPRGPLVSFPVVGIGASAGGLEAFTQLFRHLPPDSGMAFVVIQHLDPTRPSFLCEALGKATRMPVTEARHRLSVKPNHVYTIPPNADVAIAEGRLVLETRHKESGGTHLPIDGFFRSLAKAQGSRAIGVVLSGTGSDGTVGLEAIKAEDGITFSQNPREAPFRGMPQNALDAGVVDYALGLPELAAELVRLGQHPYVARGAEPSQGDEALLKALFTLVRTATGVDFSEYKSPVVSRRLARRMALRRVDGLREYLTLLEKDRAEVVALHDDILIHVTSFFRDPEVFEGLKTEAFPEILKQKPAGAPVRFWVAGCSTGEEVYSLAIVLLEYLQDTEKKSAHPHPIQIFASDVSEAAIQRARNGVYSEGALREVSLERRRRYFTRVDRGYRINKAVRDLCVFARHDLARDPPFSKMDLVSCRNVLIYFEPALQKRVVPGLHYALNKPGFLLLGRAESISAFGPLFNVVDKARKIFARSTIPSALRFAPRSGVQQRRMETEGLLPSQLLVRAGTLTRHLDRMLLSRYAPPGVLVNERADVLEFRGQTGAYLQAASGEPQNNLFKMVRGGLLGTLRACLSQAMKEMAPVRRTGVAVEGPSGTHLCDVVVIPFAGLPEASEPFFIVLFEQPAARSPRRKKAEAGRPRGETRPERKRTPELEHELFEAKEYLQAVLEEHARTNDDLVSANEELVSGNEELQSMNEELETAKEELQSTNEELTTVNDELNSRNQEVSQVNSDLVNLLTMVDVPILFLDRERKIRRFTPKARSILNVMPSDLGRSLIDIRTNIEVPNLDELVAEVIETISVKEMEVQDREQHWYRLQIRPYKSLDNRIDGAILSLTDIDVLKLHVSDAQQATAQAEQANRTKDHFLATLSHELRTPLSSILMQAQLLRRGSGDPAKVKRAADAIERGTKMQVQLIDDLLDVSRIVTGKLKMERERVELGPVVAAALEGVSGLAEKKVIRLEASGVMPGVVVLGDPTRLQQVVSNLLTNAIKFTPESGSVTTVLEAHDGKAVIRVSDTGSGIDPTFLPRVFDRFSQQDESRARTYGGLGLGLAIVHHLVQQHGGTVQADSAGLGKGAVFQVTLPLMARGADGLVRAAGVDGVPRQTFGSLRGVRLLIVEDDVDSRDAVAELLREKGAVVMVSGSAAEGLALVEKQRPGVILCDISMPGDDGYAFLKRVRALSPQGGGETPAIALTALAGVDDERRSIAAGFQRHVSKPADIESLGEVIAELADSAPLPPVDRLLAGKPLGSGFLQPEAAQPPS